MSLWQVKGRRTALARLGLKTAYILDPIKGYNHVLENLHSALKSTNNATSSASRGFALHGTQNLPHILDAGHVLPSKMGPRGQLGPGVYWWKGFPQNMPDRQYLTAPHHEGLLTDLHSIPQPLPNRRNIYTGEANTDVLVTGPGNYNVRPNDTAVINSAARKNLKGEGNLEYMLADAEDKNMNVIDSPVFHRAYRDFRESNKR